MAQEDVKTSLAHMKELLLGLLSKPSGPWFQEPYTKGISGRGYMPSAMTIPQPHHLSTPLVYTAQAEQPFAAKAASVQVPSVIYQPVPGVAIQTKSAVPPPAFLLPQVTPGNLPPAPFMTPAMTGSSEEDVIPPPPSSSFAENVPADWDIAMQSARARDMSRLPTPTSSMSSFLAERYIAAEPIIATGFPTPSRVPLPASIASFATTLPTPVLPIPTPMVAHVNAPATARTSWIWACTPWRYPARAACGSG